MIASVRDNMAEDGLNYPVGLLDLDSIGIQT